MHHRWPKPDEDSTVKPTNKKGISQYCPKDQQASIKQYCSETRSLTVGLLKRADLVEVLGTIGPLNIMQILLDDQPKIACWIAAHYLHLNCNDV